jgi:Uncharacterised nucleotidyltransferase
MVQLTKEESLLILTCRISLGKDDEARVARIVRNSPDWSFLLWRAETYQTIPLLQYHVQRLKLEDALPDEVTSYLQNWTALSQARSREQFRELGRIVQALQRLGIDHFLMKGAAIASTVYPDPLLRPMQDLDIMIQPRDAWRVQRAIYRLGYKHGVFNSQDGRFTPLFRKITSRSLRLKHALHSVTRTVRVPSLVPTRLIPLAWRKRQLKSFVHEDGTISIPIFIDFHVNLSAGMALSDVWRGVKEQLILGQLVKAQSPTSMLWFSAARLYNEAFEHGTLKLQMFGDIDAILRAHQDELDWAELLVMAKKYKIEPALYYVLTQAKRLNGSPIPAGVLSLLEPSQLKKPADQDWGDIIPKLLSRPLVSNFEFA